MLNAECGQLFNGRYNAMCDGTGLPGQRAGVSANKLDIAAASPVRPVMHVSVLRQHMMMRRPAWPSPRVSPEVSGTVNATLEFSNRTDGRVF